MPLRRDYSGIVTIAGVSAFVLFVAVIAESLISPQAICPECGHRMIDKGVYQPPGTKGLRLLDCPNCGFATGL